MSSLTVFFKQAYTPFSVNEKRARQSTLLALASNGSDGFQKVKKEPVIFFPN
jgi:hypothetical protein